ncbi:Putative NAD(P)H-dependent FMN-containing oxidoreductase YwqN [Methanolapillus ohkumae]|uniref:NAD(P)H-dependent FMN-containing oxidoreductase YwqN n=2 Tax=Methanolapillus ohkumae TaxID=3028298 RepID=A0AA96V6K6_9EURY|nr:Putative NAD(P)H-dependent FMN-containing oxidoreductase YwqN [Methanosarcinaceae archaeon Am2]
MKMIGFCGSPRRRGNTEILMEMIQSTVEDAGISMEIVGLADVDIGFCSACDACHVPGGKCILDDDMDSLAQKMKEADIWVFGTPVYWWGPTAQMKVFMDRWYGISKTIFQNKKAILVIPMEDTDDKTASHVVGMFQDALDYVGVEILDTVVAKGVWSAGDVKEKPEILQAAKDAAQKAVSVSSKKPAAKPKGKGQSKKETNQK